MNQVFETRSPRTGWNQARANRDLRNAERLDTTESLKRLQAQRIRASVRCTNEVARTLAYLVYGERRS